jgi:hypothetical protein
VPVTLSDARTQLRDLLDEASANFWTDAQLNTWINNGAQDIARKAKCLLEKQSIQVFNDVGTYAAPGNVVEFHRVEYLPAQSPNVYVLTFRNYSEMDSLWGINQQIQNYYPNYWTLWREPPNTQIILYPIPSTAGTLNVQYYRTATLAVNDTDTIDIPEGWDDVVVEFGMWKALLKKQDPRWSQIRQAYNDNLAAIMVATSAGYSDNVGSFTRGPVSGPIWPFGGGFDGDGW